MISIPKYLGDRYQRAIAKQRASFRACIDSSDLASAKMILSGRSLRSVIGDDLLAIDCLKFFYECGEKDYAGKIINLLTDSQLHLIAGSPETTKYVFGVIGWRPYVHFYQSWGLIERIFKGYGIEAQWDATVESFISSTPPYGLRVCGCRKLPSKIRKQIFGKMDGCNILASMGYLNVTELEKAAVLRLSSVGPEFIAMSLELIGWQRTGFHVGEALKVAGLLNPEVIDNSPEIQEVLARAAKELEINGQKAAGIN